MTDEETVAQKRNPSYLQSIESAVESFERLNADKVSGRGASRDEIYKYCELNRSFTNKLQMLNQIRLALRRAVADGVLTQDGERFCRAQSNAK